MAPDGLLKVGIPATYLALFLFIYRNLRLRGVKLIAVGVMLNFAVILANGGLMPLAPETLDQISPTYYREAVSVGDPVPASKDILLPRHDTALWWLSDVFTLPGPVSSWRIAFSVGDIFIVVGLLYALTFLTVKLVLNSNGSEDVGVANAVDRRGRPSFGN